MSQVNGRYRFSAICGSETPEPIELKFGVTDYVREGTTHANLVAIGWAGGTGQIPDLYHYFLSFFTSYVFDSNKQATADTAEPILTRNGSNDVSV